MPRRITPETAARKARLLGFYATHGHLRLACEQADVPRGTHRTWLADDPEYARAFQEAEEEATERLIEEVHRRGFLGWEEPLTYQGGLCYEKLPNGRKKQIAIRRFDSNLAMFLLKAKRPEQFRDTWKGELKTTAIVSRGPDLTRLSDADLDYLERIAEHVSLAAAVAGVAESGSDPGGEGTPSENED